MTYSEIIKQTKLSSMESTVLFFIMQGAVPVDTFQLMHAVYGAENQPIHARLVIGGCIKRLNKKLSRANCGVVVQQTERSGPYPCQYFIQYAQ